jgi:hypothetical protein
VDSHSARRKSRIKRGDRPDQSREVPILTKLVLQEIKVAGCRLDQTAARGDLLQKKMGHSRLGINSLVQSLMEPLESLV